VSDDEGVQSHRTLEQDPALRQGLGANVVAIEDQEIKEDQRGGIAPPPGHPRQQAPKLDPAIRCRADELPVDHAIDSRSLAPGMEPIHRPQVFHRFSSTSIRTWSSG
jgi:hypothetical protein